MSKLIFSIVFYYLIYNALKVTVGYTISYFYTYRKSKQVDNISSKKCDNKLISLNEKKVKFSIKKYISKYLEGIVRVTLVHVGRIKSQILRKWIYRNIFHVNIEKNVVIYGDCEIRSPHFLNIGKGSIIGDQCQLDARNIIEIGENVCFGTGVWVWTEQHDVNCPQFGCGDKGGKVVIGDRAWISSRVTILPNVNIGEGAVIASGSVVTKDIEPFSINGGVPSKKIGTRNNKLNYEFKGEFLPFR